VKLYAISDLHISHPANYEALSRIGHYPEDWLLLGGDICESPEELAACLEIVTRRFERVFWVPGNHELWTTSADPDAPRGEAKYRELVRLCRNYGVTTPEDEFVRWTGDGPACTIAPLFVLYDYSFRGDVIPRDLDIAQAIEYSRQAGVVCVDEELLHADPYPDRSAWCHARARYTEERLAQTQGPLILLNHYPLREEFSHLFLVPTFILWCGTRLTEDWHTRYPVHTAVSGHLHIRRDRIRDGVRFVEVSLGYPRQWDQERPIDSYLCEILPGR
jgi:3',5'-cyclic AMP phosphodiesterase CpdA